MSAAGFETLIALRGHVRIAHHVPGRIRLRIAASAVGKLGQVDRDRVEKALRAIDGIRAIRVNPAAASVVVEYAPSRISPNTWDILLNGDPEDARQRMRALLGSDPESLANDIRQAKPIRSSDKE
jgi:hypothetical protein